MAVVLRNSAELAAVHGVKALTYGKAGLGKTSLCATAPNPVILSAESGLLSLAPANLVRMYGENTPGITYQIPVIEVTTIEQLTEAYNWAATSAEASQFQTICLDSITEIAEVVLANAKRQVKDPRQAYGELLEKMVMTIKAFRDLSGKHVYMTAKQEQIKEEGSGLVLSGPSFPGAKLGQGVTYLFDEVFQIGVGRNPDNTSYRFLRTQPDFNADAKDRSGTLATLETPHLGYIFAKIQGLV